MIKQLKKFFKSLRIRKRKPEKYELSLVTQQQQNIPQQSEPQEQSIIIIKSIPLEVDVEDKEEEEVVLRQVPQQQEQQQEQIGQYQIEQQLVAEEPAEKQQEPQVQTKQGVQEQEEDVVVEVQPASVEDGIKKPASVTDVIKDLPSEIREEFHDRLFSRIFSKEQWSYVDRSKVRQLNRYYSNVYDGLVDTAKLTESPHSNLQRQRRTSRVNDVFLENEYGVSRFVNLKTLIIAKDAHPEDLAKISNFIYLQEVYFEDVAQVWDLVELMCENKHIQQQLLGCRVSFPLSCMDELEEIIALSGLLGKRGSVVVRWNVTFACKYRPGFQQLLQVLSQTSNCCVELEGCCNILPSEWMLQNKHKIKKVEFHVQSESFIQMCSLMTNFLRDNSTLQNLIVKWERISGSQFQSMSQTLKKQLQNVRNVKWCSEESSLSQLSDFQNVCCVEMNQSDDSICNLKGLMKLPRLSQLIVQFPEMGRQKRWQHMALIGQLKKLTQLELYDKEQQQGERPNLALSEGELMYLGKLTCLKKLKINFDDVAIKDLAFTLPMKGLDELDVGMIACPGFHTQDATHRIRNIKLQTTYRQYTYQRQPIRYDYTY